MNTKQIIKKIEEGFFDARLLEIYVDDGMLEYQKKRYADAVREYEKRFGEDDVKIFSVPGRSEVAGNHTDHQHGCVMACSINLDIIIVAAYADEFRLYSNGREIEGININDLSLKMSQQHTSLALVKGVLHKLKQDGHKIGNVRAVMNSNVLVGSGLSSSAAFEVAVGAMMSFMFNDGKISKIEIAKDSQYAENVYFGKPSGLMDQTASSVGNILTIDFEDPEKPVVNKLDVDFDQTGLKLCIINCWASHADLTGEYAAVPVEMQEIAGYFGQKVLRKVDRTDFLNAVPELRRKFGDRAVLRAFHFYADNDRVPKQAEALESGKIDEFLRLISESGRSSWMYLQNIVPNGANEHQEMAVALALCDVLLNGKGAFRVHGGGFAGTCQAFVPEELIDQFTKDMERLLGEGCCHVLNIRSVGGTRVG